MKAHGVTQDALSEALNMTQGGLQHWLAGTRHPKLEDIDRIATRLGVPGAYLTHGVTADALATGLEEPALSVIRQLITGARSGALDARVFAHLQSTLALVAAPQAATATPAPARAAAEPARPDLGAHRTDVSRTFKPKASAPAQTPPAVARRGS